MVSGKRNTRAAFGVAGIFLLTLFLCEAGARLAGFQPWDSPSVAGPGFYDPDSALGWIHREGKYRIRTGFSGKDRLEVTFLADGGRKTSDAPPPERAGEIIVIGDSFSEGWALSDSDTYPWKLQEKFPSHRVLNYGTGAYGTCQSLIMLERVLPEAGAPRAVVYGFFHHHPERNVAEAGWLEGLDRFSPEYRVGLPYATLDGDGALVGQDCEYYPHLPLRGNSAFVVLLERTWAHLRSRHRTAQKEAVTRALLLRMNEVSEERGAKFYFVPLSVPEEEKKRYMEFLTARNIRSVDCSIYPIPDELTIPGEGHPNGLANTRWTECIFENLKRDLSAAE